VPTSVFPVFFQGAPGPVGEKGSVGRPGPLGKKVNSYRFQMLRKGEPHFFDFHVNSSHDPGTINYPFSAINSFPSSVKSPHFTRRDTVYSPIIKQL